MLLQLPYQLIVCSWPPLYLLLSYLFWEKQFKSQLFMGFILNKIVMPILSVVIITYMFFGLLDSSRQKLRK